MTAKLGLQNYPKTQYLSGSVRAALDTCWFVVHSEKEKQQETVKSKMVAEIRL